jgi:hypothetical protein
MYEFAFRVGHGVGCPETLVSSRAEFVASHCGPGLARTRPTGCMSKQINWQNGVALQKLVNDNQGIAVLRNQTRGGIS